MDGWKVYISLVVFKNPYLTTAVAYNLLEHLLSARLFLSQTLSFMFCPHVLLSVRASMSRSLRHKNKTPRIDLVSMSAIIDFVGMHSI